MNAAAQIGDDTLQSNAGRTVQPHTFTHGTSEKHQRWFQTGYDTSQITACNTFEANSLKLTRRRVIAVDAARDGGYSLHVAYAGVAEW
jgi:hypothetical protein